MILKGLYKKTLQDYKGIIQEFYRDSAGLHQIIANDTQSVAVGDQHILARWYNVEDLDYQAPCSVCRGILTSREALPHPMLIHTHRW